MDTSDPLVPPSPSTDRDLAAECTLAEWRVHLLAANPSALMLIVPVSLAGAVFGALALRHWVGGVLALLFILSSLAEFLFPITYRLTTRGAYCSYGLARLAMTWQQVRRVVRRADGLLLSPFCKPTRLDAFRGIELRFARGGEKPEPSEIIALVSHWTEISHRGR